MQTLLLVDDEPNIVEGLASQVQQKYGDQLIVLKSFSGTHALSILRNNQVDVVLSDICMPDLDGLALLRETEKLWPHTHFVFLSGFDDFQYIHQASKSPLYSGYLLKMEGDDVVLAKLDEQIRLCREEARRELEQDELRSQYQRMQGFLQHAALESILRGGSSWKDLSAQFFQDTLPFQTGAPVYLVLGKYQINQIDRIDTLLKIDRLLTVRLARFRFASLMPEEGAFAWILQNAEGPQETDASYLYALFEAIQQRLGDSGSQVSFVLSNATPFPCIGEKYALLERIYSVSVRDRGMLVMVEEDGCANAVLSRESVLLNEQLRFSRLLHQLNQCLRSGPPSQVQEMFREYREEAGGLRTEHLFTLFTLILQAGRDLDTGSAGEEAVLALADDALHAGQEGLPGILERYQALCEELSRRREAGEAHDAQAVVERINRYIADNIENYDLSLTELARMTGFNPSYLSRFYRINTGRKLSEQIDGEKLRHAKELIRSGELVKNVAERTGFASPSAFILFFKRNTGMTPKQYFDQKSAESPQYD